MIEYDGTKECQTSYSLLVDDRPEPGIVIYICLSSPWVTIDDVILYPHLIEVFIAHDVAILPDQIQQRGDLVDDVLWYHPVPYGFCELGPFVTLTKRGRNINNGVLNAILALLDAMVSGDVCGDVVCLQIDRVHDQVPHGSVPGPNTKGVKLVLCHH